MTIRPAAVAGSFYPGSQDQLEEAVNALLAEAPTYHGGRPRILIVPHAGYIYSGLTAAFAYNSLKPYPGYRRVLLLGPAHRVAFHGIAFPTDDAFQTPLGNIQLDIETIEALTDLDDTGYLNAAHELEHSLEVQLPFLQQLLPDALLIPAVVGDTSAETVQQLIQEVWDSDTLIVISTDLSHFHPYREALEIDQDSIAQIAKMEPTLTGHQACGCRPLNGLLQFANQKELRIKLLDYRNSGDTAGGSESVVGYASFAVYDKYQERSHAQ